MLFKSSKSKKIAATFILAVMLNNMVFPTVSYALTSGPTQPEATSFEPVDTTDMVNLQTGDFTYNIPLLEVPGPEGGYPLSLSYHAGIQPNEDASWVGLGWTLNPGAINRSVNGYPDDWQNVNNTQHTYWSGGSTTTYSIGYAGFSGVSANLSFSQDTYKGFGFGASLGWGTSAEGLGGSISIGISAYGGGAYVGGGVGISVPISSNVTGSVGMQVKTNFTSLTTGFSASVSVSEGFGKNKNSIGLLGASISSNSSSGFNVGGMSAPSSANFGNIQTHTSGLNLPVPTPIGIFSLGYSKTRYWINETTNTPVHGSLYETGWPTYYTAPSFPAFDTYELEDDSDPGGAYINDECLMQGGAYLDFDLYNVNAQGLSGNMRPYQFQGRVNSLSKEIDYTINNQSSYASNMYLPKTTSSSPQTKDSMPQFRFIGDFSNTYQQRDSIQTTPSSDNSPTPILNHNTENIPFDGNPIYGNNDGNFGYGGGNKLAGSRHIDMGVKIKPATLLGNGFDINNSRWQPGMINGFSITNESGVTYHFGLPAYTYGEQMYQQKISTANGLYYNRQTKNTPYAYTWYLTTITGPDYVDRNGNGIADDGDWGYWVNFGYGKWSDNYVWRNPSEGYNTDEDNQWKDCSMGYKEVYYLNAIRTRSHIALFEKSIRLDGKGSSSAIFNTTNNGNQYQDATFFDNTSANSLKLEHIYLLNAADENIVQTTSASPALRSQDLAGNVLDNYDVDAVGRSNIQAKAIRIIDFNYDYSLCQNTSNSFDVASAYALSGKLSLNSIVTKGKSGADLLPPTRFNYNLNNDQVIKATGTFNTTGFTTNSTNLGVGDMLETDEIVPTYCGMITGPPTQSGSSYTYPTANGINIDYNNVRNIRTTKNPSYNKNCYDIWGMYKGDFNLGIFSNNPSLARVTTLASSKSVDAWSLRTITSPLGEIITMGYEPGQFSNIVIQNSMSFTIDASSALNDAPFTTYNTQIKFKVNTYGYDISNFFSVGGTGTIMLAIQQSNGSVGMAYLIDPNAHRYYSTSPYTITAIDADGTIHATLNYSIYPQGSSNNYYKIVGGNLSSAVNSSYNLYGGLRIGNITATENNGRASITNYNYNSPTKTSLSSGVVSYLPDGGFLPGFIPTSSQDANGLTFMSYMKTLSKANSNLYKYVRQLPPPGIMYQYVTVTNLIKNPDETSVRNIEGTNLYQFQVYNNDMLDMEQPTAPIVEADPGSVTNWREMGAVTKNFKINRFISSLGKLIRLVQYDSNGSKISETVNHYLHDAISDLPTNQFFSQYATLLAQYNYQGYTSERAAQYKLTSVLLHDGSAKDTSRFTMSALEQYPCIQTGQTVINYVNGTQTSTQTLGFDFYSGAVTSSLATDAYGNNVLTESVPAYTKYPAMGLKINNANNKNMLSQVAETRTWSVDANNNNKKLGLISASATTWSDMINAYDIDGKSYTQNDTTRGSLVGDVWRMQSTYNWMPTGTTSTGMTDPATFNSNEFNFGNPSSSNSSWKNTSTITRYDVYSKALEAKDINGNYAATHMTYGDMKVNLTGGPAKYNEIAYSGAEDGNINQAVTGFVQAGDGTVTNAAAHTGKQSLLLNAGGKRGFVYSAQTNDLTPGRSYQASVWVKPTGSSSNVKLYYSINGGTTTASLISSATSTKTAGGWTLVNLLIPGTAIAQSNTLTVWCQNDDGANAAYVDDIRFQPVNAATTAYVYDPFSGELTHILDNNNLYVRYEYDGVGRLVRTYKEKLGIGEYKTAETQYNYGLPLYTPPPPVQSVYARLEYLNYVIINNQDNGTNTISSTSADVYIKFYADAACTIPTVVDASIVFFYSVTSNSPNPSIYSVNNTSGLQYISLGNWTLDYSSTPDDHNSQDPGQTYVTTLDLLSGPNYVVEQALQ